MNKISRKISHGKTEIDYELLMMNRKTLEIAVHPDKNIVVKAPKNSTLEAIEEKIKKKAEWIKKQISYFSQFEPKTPKKQYLDGENHLYLGKKYPLKINLSDKNIIFLKSGQFQIETISEKPEQIKKLMELWYREKAKIYLSQIFENCWQDFKKDSLNKPNLKLRKMEKRWGSFSSKGQVTLNVKLIQAPTDCIEYVIIHELCHMIYYNHSPQFYKLLNSVLPDWMSRKHKLEMALI